METSRIPYKQDTYGNDLFARVSWSNTDTSTPKPIVMILHGGGFMVGSSDIIPGPQIETLCEKNFVCVTPNYRLAPQVTAVEAFRDCEEAFDWAAAVLPRIMASTHAIQIDTGKMVAMGHSAGGTLALHMASCRPVKAVTAFYPSLFYSDPTTSVHQPSSAPPFGPAPNFFPSTDDWAEITPSDRQISEATIALPPPARNRWQMHLIKHGKWISTIQPDGDLASIDPTTKFGSEWPPVMIVQGENDKVPGSELVLAQRAVEALRAKGVRAELEVVAGESHMFDLSPTVGTTDVGAKWKAVLKGLDWLSSHV